LPAQEEGIASMFNLLDQAFANMVKVLEGDGDPDDSWTLENDIDALRDTLRTQNTMDVDAGKYSFTLGTIFVDIVRECEKCGDYVINAVEAKVGKREDADHLNIEALVIDHQRKIAQLYGEPMDLTKSEFELLSLLVSNPGRIFTREELLESVWPKDSSASAKVVDGSIREIRSKLGDMSVHVVNKPGVGYYFE
ncbi:MAG: winged helix-turn-helix transcriptional regulator, partial [Bacteroidales bacterium]|nr:winged helix-turn-helix transcriptional regulator [Bacteroidales bacterium]